MSFKLFFLYPGLRNVINKSIFITFSILIPVIISGQPVCKVDLNVADRHEEEVNEPNYTPWPTHEGPSESIVVNGITFTLSGNYYTGWYKAGVQSPYYARLANDGIFSGPGVQLIISGLEPGRHTLLTFHNTVHNPLNNTFPPIDIYLNDSLIYNDLIQTNRALSNAEAATAYFVFDVSEDEDVVLFFTPDTNTDATSVEASLNGFELNTSNAECQASAPVPEDNDEHVDADNDSLLLCWKAASMAISHNVYFGTDSSAVADADQSSEYFIKNQTDTCLLVTGLYSREKYFWRIDEHDSSGIVTKGDIWFFRPRQLAFPGAEGYGRYAIGGRGGKVVEVTSLNDDGPGSLREAVTNDIGPRTIVFNVSGIITLQSRLVLKHDKVTVAGQTAPGKGICIRGAPFGMSGATDCMIRHLRVRIGSGITYDGMGMQGSDHSIIDHCSISWSIDEAFSSRSAHNITLQRTLISEPLNVAGHDKYPYGTEHGYAASISGDVGSFHHNLLAHCSGRNWSLAGGLDGNGYFAGRLDIFNNVVYNWHYRVTDGGAHEVNFVNNYYKRGSASNTNITYALKAQYENFPGTQQYYFKGNIMPQVFDESNQESGRIYTGTPDGYNPWVDEPFFESGAVTQPVREAYKNVLSDVGCTQPVFDDHDMRIIRETFDGTYTYVGSYTGLPGIPDDEADVGGWEEYPHIQRGSDWDSDHDGLPDWWENHYGLNPDSPAGDFSDANADPDKDGYTCLNDYLNWMALPHNFITPDSVLAINLQDMFQGYKNDPLYSVLQTEKGEAFLHSDTLVHFIPEGEGLGSLTLKVEDAAGDTMVRIVGIFIGESPSDTVTAMPDNFYEQRVFNAYCFPNPASDQVSLIIEMEEAQRTRICLTNITGKVIMEDSYTLDAGLNHMQIDISPYASGVYNLFIVTKTDIKSILLIKYK
ncbi:MAG: T9SS type A sorting domain-containing protein [Bacteroidales bacterium]|nr:T9SS type A sorting domain-containing protein [Bacteroidales bacterium]